MFVLSLAILLAMATPMPPEPIHGTFSGINSFANTPKKQKHEKHHRKQHAPPGKKMQ